MMTYNISEQRKDVDLTEISVDRFSETDLQEVENIKKGICFDYESISGYAKDATKKLTEFSAQILDSVKVKDAPEIEGMLVSLVGELDRFNAEDLKKEKKGLLSRFFHSDKAETFLIKYKTISSVISETKAKLEQAEFQLQKDVKVSEAYMQMNRGYIRELEKYILAADMRIAEEREWIESEKAKVKPYDTFAVQEIAVKEAELNGLEKKAYNLRIQRTIAIQNIPQLMLIKDGDATLIAKIDDSINQAIPLWESQIVIGLTALRQKAGAEVSKSISNTTNNLLKQNAETLKQSAIAVAEENERSIVEIDTVKNSNNALIETINGVRQAQKQGEERRKQGIKELVQIQEDLNHALLDTYA